MNTQLGRLEPVELRTVWKKEDSDFTPWLAQEENLTLLGDAIGLELELDDQEQWVGQYRADIVCRDTLSDFFVIIENQLERTNHSHLGQLLTYAAGLNAVAVVWIANRFTDEHRAALNWLNDITDESANFFGLEIELWQIADSPIAPKFNIVSQPNEWIKTTGGGRRPPIVNLSKTQQLQLEYWTAFRDYLEESGSNLKGRKPYPQNWMDFAIGRGRFWLSASINTRDNRIEATLVMTGPDVVAHYHLLQLDKTNIENEIGTSLYWNYKEGRKQNYVSLNQDGIDLEDRRMWAEQHEWLRRYVEIFHGVFSSRVKNLDASQYDYAENKEKVEL